MLQYISLQDGGVSPHFVRCLRAQVGHFFCWTITSQASESPSHTGTYVRPQFVLVNTNTMNDVAGFIYHRPRLFSVPRSGQGSRDILQNPSPPL